jgi:arginyl-tRNA synthetase
MGAMADPLATVSDLLRPVFAEIAGGAEVDPVVRPSDRADAQVNGALPLAKQLGDGTTPRQIAERVVASGVLDDVCSAVEVAGPGFVNLTFDPGFLAAELERVAVDDRLGVAPAAVTRTVVVDYSAPNVAKEMHVGHLRSTVIGDALVRMLEFAGHRVIRENHIGDWGRPFGMLIEHLIDVGEDAAAEGMKQGDLDGFYKQANAKFNEDPEFQERSRARVVKLQSYDPDTIAIWKRLVEMSNEYFDLVYRKLGVLLTDDDLAGESRYQSLMPEVYERLEKAGLLADSDGAKVVFPPGFYNRDNEPLPLIVRSRTGAFMYATSDLACVVDRIERLGADLLLYVIGAPQAQHLQMVFEVCRMAGWLRPPAEAVHVPFGSVLGPDRKMLRSRSGDAVKLVELLDEAVERAAAAVAEKNASLDPDTQAEVARMVGIGAVKYADLSTDRIKDYVFDWDRMLAFDGNTAPYLQYAHARICSIFRRAGVERSDVRAAPITVAEPQERALAQRLLAYPSALADTLGTYSPHKLCTYLFELAQDFTAFYEHCPVMRADEPVRTSRLAICDLTARTLEHGLGLLGIAAPAVM